MKKQENHKIGLRKLTIARISTKTMKMINGGDCIVTEDTWTHILESDAVCPTSEIP